MYLYAKFQFITFDFYKRTKNLAQIFRDIIKTNILI